MKSKTKRRLKKVVIGLVVFCALIGVSLIIVPYVTTGASWDSTQNSNSLNTEPSPQKTNDVDSVMTVMTANIAHGRGTGRHQALLSRGTIRSNLGDIAKLFRREKPDIIALQEADGPSLWSGRFNHVKYLAAAAGFPHQFRGEHVNGLKTSYGTALLSRVPLTDRASQSFAPSPPTLSKGYVVSRVSWPGHPDVKVTVVSVHLDFYRASVRKAQVEKMIRKLSDRARPLIIMGDFNCDWNRNEESLRALAEGLRVRAYEPKAEKNMGTFSSSGKRLDWILISVELKFDRYETLTDKVSDHRCVLATLKFVPTQ